MTYTHTWRRVEAPDGGSLPAEPRDAYGHLAFDTLAIIAAAQRTGIVLADGAARPGSRPVVDEGGIWLNGAAAEHAETFAWPAVPSEPWWSDQPGQRWVDFCATNRQPYDAVVCAVLIRAAVHYGPSVQIRSDGAWDGARDVWEPDWVSGRCLVVDVFGSDADCCPFAP